MLISLVGILMDMNTGDIVLDANDHTIQVNNKRAFEQVIDGLFHCQKGTEIMNPKYGFDITTALRESYSKDSEMFIESLVIMALNPEVEKQISSLDYVKATKDGSDMTVIIQVTSIMGETITMEEVILMP